MGSNEIQTARMVSYRTSEADPLAEVRREIRYPLRARSEFVWVGRDGAQHEASGYSRDISEHGAYILAKTCPPMGAMIRTVIRFPYRRDPARSRLIEMDGRVMRVELLLTHKAGWGFAVASTHSVLHDIDESDDESSVG
jgi:PilZ domain